MSEFDFDLDFDEQTVGAFGAIPTQASAPAEKDDDPFNFANINMSEQVAPAPVVNTPSDEELQTSSSGTSPAVNNQPVDDPFDFPKAMEAAPLEYASPFDIAPQASTEPEKPAPVQETVSAEYDDFDEATVGAFGSFPLTASVEPAQNNVVNKPTSVQDINNAFKKPETPVAQPAPFAPAQNNVVNKPTSVQDINNAFKKPETPAAQPAPFAPAQNNVVNKPTSVQDINNAFGKPVTVPENQTVQPGTISLAAKAVLQKEMEKTKKTGIKMLVGAAVLLLFFPISIPLAIGGAGKLKKASQIKKQIEQG